MNLVTPGVVLARKPYGEYGRIAMLYTLELGKVPARLAGVDRPKGKLKAFAEPMTYAEYRLYLRPGSVWATVTGGRLVDSYPELSLELDRILGGLEICELLLRMTPDRSPNPRKFELLTRFLEAQSKHSSPWFALAFGLRLLELSGLGLGDADVSMKDRAVLNFLLSCPPMEISGMEKDSPSLERLHESTVRTVEAYAQRPLQVPKVRASVSGGLKETVTA